MDSPQIFSMKILIISCPWVLLGSTSEITIAISLLLNTISDNFFVSMIKQIREAPLKYSCIVLPFNSVDQIIKFIL